MMRKRASFKPNLKPATAPPVDPCNIPRIIEPQSSQLQEQQQQSQSTPQQKTLSPAVSPLKQQQQPPTLSPHTPPPSQTTSQQEEGISSQQQPAENQRIQEAIAQLTGQKFEPIKSLSLRSSANKNVKLKDLLFFNPPMTKDQKRHKKSVSLAKKNKNSNSTDTSPVKSPLGTPRSNGNEETEEEPSLVPKVKMGPEGKLVLDESSTIINRKNLIKEQEAIIEDNDDIISRTNYDSFRRRPSSTSQTKWSIEDTKKFYHALTIFGTDFSMMESLLFSGFRSRTELHKKFKREERVNKPKIDIALSNRISLNSEELEDLREIFQKE